jgi:hypothetical protein
MNFNKLYQDTTSHKYIDAKLIVTDREQTIDIRVHKIILANQCDYFDKLFTFGNQTTSTYPTQMENIELFGLMGCYKISKPLVSFSKENFCAK